MTSQYTGVRSERGKWRAEISVKGKKQFLGYRDNEIEAAKLYDAAAATHGRHLNFPVIAPAPKKTISVKLNVTAAPKPTTTAASAGISPTWKTDPTTGLVVVDTLQNAVAYVVSTFTKNNESFTRGQIAKRFKTLADSMQLVMTGVPFLPSKLGGYYQPISGVAVKEAVISLFDAGSIPGYKETYNKKSTVYSKA